MIRSERSRARLLPLLLYPALALLTFPVVGAILAGQNGRAYALDVFDDGGEVPRLAIITHDWTNGITLWDPHLTAGNALLGQFAISPFALDTLLALIIGPFGAWIMVSWLMPAVAGISMHLFLRDSLSIPRPAVIGGSVIYMFGSWHYSYGFSILLLPLFLWLADRVVRPSGGWREIVAGSVLGAVALYEGLSQCVLIAAAIQLAFLLALDVERTRRDRLTRWIAMWVGALGLYGPVLTTQLVTLSASQRSIWDLIYLYKPTLSNAVSTVVHHYAAVFSGVPLGSGFGPGEFRYGTLFLGSLGLPLFVLGVVAGRRDRRSLFILALLAAIPLLDVAAILATPVQQHLDAFLKSFQFIRIRHFYPFAVAATAALGIDVLIGLDRRWVASRRRMGLVVASIVPIGVALAVGVGHLLRTSIVTPGEAQVQTGWLLTVLALVVGLLAAGLVAVAFTRKGWLPGRYLTRALVIVGLLLVAERALYASGSALMGPNISSYSAALAETSGEEFLSSQPGIDEERVFTFGDQANRMTVPGFLQVDGYQSAYPLTYHDFFGRLIGPQLAADPVKNAYFNKWGGRAYAFGQGVDPALVALAGVRWLYVVGDEVPTVPGLISRWHAGNVTIYEVPSVLPRAFVVGSVKVDLTTAESLDALSAASLGDLRGQAFAAASAPLDAAFGGNPATLATPGPAGSATITAAAPDRVELEVNATRPGLLVLTDVMAPGWVAQRDGQGVPIATVDGTFRGVAVAPGDQQVVFLYQPSFTYAGFGLAVVTAAILALLAAWSAWRERRRRS